MTRHNKLVSASVVAVFALFYTIAMIPKAQGYPPFMTQAQKLGYPAKNCAYCHTTATGGDKHNARGLWLIDQKKKRDAQSIDVKWLSDYKAVATAKSKGKGRAKKKA